jgi:hypothetical protein
MRKERKLFSGSSSKRRLIKCSISQIFVSWQEPSFYEEKKNRANFAHRDSFQTVVIFIFLKRTFPWFSSLSITFYRPLISSSPSFRNS